MTTSNRFTRTLGILMITLFTFQVSTAQTFSVNNSASELVIEGTSNLHDWEMVAEQVKGTLKATLENGKLNQVDQLTFAVVAESLKSGKGQMDKNAYKAIDTKNHKEIQFQLQEVENINCSSDSACELKVKGTLSIAGTTRPIELSLNAATSNTNIVLSGEYTLKMTQYKVDPPKAMFGAVTTGDDLKIKFKIQYSN